MEAYGRFSNVFPIRGPKRPKFGVRPAGQVSWSPAGSRYFTYATDSAGNQVDIDSNGHPIAGTVTSSGGTTLDDSAWQGAVSVGGEDTAFYTGGTPAPGVNVSATVLSPQAISSYAGLLGMGLADLTSALNSGNQIQIADIQSRTATQIAALNSQAATAQAQGNLAAANAARDSARQLMQFQAQLGASTSMSTMTMLLIGLGILTAGGIAYAVISKPSGGGSRRSSARRNPSRRHGRRNRRRHRR